MQFHSERGPTASTASSSLLQPQGSGYRLNNGYSAGPDPTQYGQHATTRAIQGDVTVDVAVNKNLYEWRAKISEQRGEHERIGAVTDAGDLHIVQHELLFCMRSRAAGRGGSTAFGFTSFNGASIATFHTQDDFEDSLVFIGRAKGKFVFNSPEQGNHGVAGQLRGAYSTANRGKFELCAGDLARWRAPSIRKAQRDADRREFHRPEGMPERKELVSLEPMTYATLHAMPQRAFKAYMAETRDATDEDVRVRQADVRTQTRHPSRLVRFAITYMRAAGMAKVFAGLAVLVEKKIATINPIVPENSTDAAAYRGALAAANAALPAKSTIDATQAGRLATLAYMCDMVDGRARAGEMHLKPAAGLINDTIETAHRGLAEPATLAASRLPLSRFVAAAGANLGAGFGAALDRAQVDATRREVQCFAETKRSEEEKIVGVVLGRAGPGEYVDILQ